ncbi:hypothetical protein SSP24_23550 [Streptomyces spinoverrucosus]|uniref:Uncharacterized protein n=1 Tax=Streptomyces spinoverrucosus TaxID=284043 RepID=A0A4Y3VFX7_9ACTN|nr:hypothetical protein SSP24_23550 [Streptomyces spinoverrucosus]GHB59027.1 hypothetical protein GCM10010397_31390 [Streptomyces spinoverrucosus]
MRGADGTCRLAYDSGGAALVTEDGAPAPDTDLRPVGEVPDRDGAGAGHQTDALPEA